MFIDVFLCVSLLIYVNGGVMSQSVEPVLLRSQIFFSFSFFLFFFLVPVRLVSFVLLPLTSLGPLVPNEYCLNDTVYLHIVADPSYNISLERSKLSQTGLLNMTVSSVNSNGAVLEHFLGLRDLHYGCAVNKPAAAVMFSC